MVKAARSLVVALSILTSAAAPAAPPPTPAVATAFAPRDGDTVEVREGDTWSPATLLKREGRKFQIRYDDGMEEWIAGDRLRPRGAGPPGVASTAPATTKPTTRTVSRVPWLAGQKVEVKWGGTWSGATVVRRQGDWSLIKYERGRSEEWVEPWRVRKVGSNEDEIPFVHPNLSNEKDKPPGPHPAPKPSKNGSASSRDYTKLAAAGDAAPLSAEAAPAEGESAAASVDLANVRTIDVKSAPANPPALAPAPAPIVQVQTARGRIALRGSTINGKITGLSLAPGAGQAFVEHTDTVKGVASGSVERVDLTNGKSTGVWKIGQGRRLGDVSGDGKFFTVVSSDHIGAGREQIELWSSDGAAAKRKFQLTPFNANKWPDREVAETFLSGDGSRFAAHNGRGQLIVFDTADGKPQYRIDVGVFGTFAIDAGSSCVLAREDKDVVFVDFASGKLLGSTPLGRGDQLVMLSPDNTRVFTTHGSTIRSSDVAGTGAAAEVTLSKPPAKLLPVEKSLVLADGALLVDVDRHAAVWRFDGKTESAKMVPGGVLVFVPPEGRGALGVANLLTPAITAAAQSAAGAEQLLLSPGTSVTVAYELNGADAVRQQIVDGSKKALDAAQLKVADGQAIRIVYHTNPGPAAERQYRTMGFGADPHAVEKRTVASQVSGVRVELNGKPVWQSQWTFAGDVFGSSQKDLDGAIADARAKSIASLATAKLPQNLLAPLETLKVGSSKLNAEVGK